MYPHSCKIRSGGLQYSPEQKRQAVIALCSRQETAAAIARKYGTTRENLYNWRRALLGKQETAMPKKQKAPLERPMPVAFETLTAANAALQKKYNELLQEAENLKEQNRQLDCDLCEKQNGTGRRPQK